MTYEHLAYIIEGAIAGSLFVKVQAVQANGETIKVYDNIISEEGGFTLIGTGTISANIAEVDLDRPLIKGEAINAYVGDFGEKTGGAILVGDNGSIPTGWKIPTGAIVDDIAYTSPEAYTEATGFTLPNVYDPESRNLTPIFPNSGIEKLLAIGFDVTIEKGIGAVVVTVENIRNCSGGYTIQFDADPAGMTNSKSYDADATVTIRVTDANQSSRYHERAIEVEIPVEPAPTSEISNASYVNNKLGSLSGIIVVADSTEPLEAQVDGVFTWTPMVFKGGNRWEKGYGVPAGPGTYTARVRVIADTGDAVSFSAVLT